MYFHDNATRAIYSPTCTASTRFELCVYIAGLDATDVFYGLHRQEVLQRPSYARLQIGTIKGEVPEIIAPVAGELSKVPYAEPAWLRDGFTSPYYKEVMSVI